MSAPCPKETLELMLGHLGFVFEIEDREEKGQRILNILTRDPGRLIGRDGHTLDELQYLLNRLMSGGEETGTTVIVDVEGYRNKEQNDFLAEVRELGEKVKRTGKPEKLSPLNSYDRRLVHQAFVDDPQIRTVSEEGNARLKVVTLVKAEE